MAFVCPGLTVSVLVLLFGAWVLVDGIFRVIGATGHSASDPDWAGSWSSEFSKSLSAWRLSRGGNHCADVSHLHCRMGGDDRRN
jgi:Short repeat of unknown function (DUF308)